MTRRWVLLLGSIMVVAALFVGLAGAQAPFGGEATAAGPPFFIEEAAAAGIDHQYDGEFPFVVGGGVAVFDCNADGRPELYLAGGSRTAALYLNQSPVGGALRFVRHPERITDLPDVTGAYPLDIDADGQTDLVVLRRGENVVLRGLGGCRFARANEAWGLDGGDAMTTAFSATWEHPSGWPTLAFGNYVDEANLAADHLCHNLLLRPGPGGGYGDAVSLTPAWCALSFLFSDWDRSGRRDLRVSNDRHYYRETSGGEEQLWRVAFGQAPRLYAREEGWQTLRVWGMGIASHDLTDDGYPEYFLTSQGDNKLQVLADGPQQPRYADMALASGVTAHRPYAGDTDLLSTAWHAEFADVNNDGYIDLFVTKGNVESLPDYATKDPSNLLIGQPDGTFVEGAETAGVVSYARARGAALADLNLDGMLDLVVVNRRAPAGLWRNLGTGSAATPGQMGAWVAIALEEVGANRDAVGAWIEVRTDDRMLRREVTVGGGHAGGQMGWIHFGLGPVDNADVRVQWPDGEVGPWLTVPANVFAVVDRDAGVIEVWEP